MPKRPTSFCLTEDARRKLRVLADDRIQPTSMTRVVEALILRAYRRRQLKQQRNLTVAPEEQTPDVAYDYGDVSSLDEPEGMYQIPESGYDTEAQSP